MVSDKYAPALVATLGLQPQVITRSLDFLLEEIEPDLAEVVLIHTSAFPYNHPHWRSLAEFREHLQKRYPAIRWRWTPIQDVDGSEVRDVETVELATQVFRIIFSEVKRIKQDGRRLHGLIAGGRKSMIVYTMVSAQLLFDVEDRLWHLFSKDEGPIPHLSPEQKRWSHLLEIPVLHLAGVMPVVRMMILNSDDPTAAIDLYREHEDVERLIHLRRFYESCDEIDREIVLLAYKGLSNSQIADQVHLAEGRIAYRINRVAERFYAEVYGRRLDPFPGRPRVRLLHDLRPLLNKLVDD